MERRRSVTKYLLIEEGNGDNEYPVDTTVTVFDDCDDALRTADLYYNTLSERERRERMVYVAAVTEEDLYPHAKRADGSVNWLWYKTCRIIRDARLYGE
jgi:hypothetical protein